MSDWIPYEDEQCIADFCEKNSGDFDLWFAENANHPAKKIDYELSYCEAHAKRFEEHAYNWINEYDACRAEKEWEERTGR